MILAMRKYTREIAQWACNLKFDDIPDRVVEECKNQSLSVLGAVFAGSRTPSGAALIYAVNSWKSAPECTLLPRGGKAGLNEALLANAGLSVALDYDDYLFAGHTGHSSVLVPLSLAETLDVSGRDIIVAQTIANEIEARIGASVMLGPLNGQMWSFIHAAGAALAAAKLLGLDPEQTASALGIALAQPNQFSPAGFARGDAKLLTASFPIMQGVAAARLAKAGLMGNSDILEHKLGFCRTFSYTPLLPALTGLGKTWLSDTLSYKIHPGCAYVSAPVDCIFEMLNGNNIVPAEISRIDVHASLLTQKMDEFALPFVRHTHTSPVTLAFYTPYNVAVALTDGKLGPEQLDPERIADPALWELARKVRVHQDIKFTTALIDNITNLLDLRKVIGNLNTTTLRELLGKMGLASPLALLGKTKDLGELIREGSKAFRKFTESTGGEFEDSLLSATAENFKMAFGARVTIETHRGEKLTCEREVPAGAAGWSLEDKRLAVIKKFEKEASAVLTDKAANRAFSDILSIETLDNYALRELIANCAT